MAVAAGSLIYLYRLPDLHFIRKDVHITNPRIVPVGTDDPALPRIARRGARQVGVFVAEIA